VKSRKPVAPFRVFGIAARYRDVTASHRPLGVNCPFRVSCPLKYDPYCLDRPTVPSAVSPALWFFPNGVRWSLFSFQSSPLFELGLPLEYYPALPSRSTAVNQLLSWALVPYDT
jgi:hypothetical protein